jgi:cysteine sulfinate desulfinase/cysteine desulfurase-like protein
MRGGTMPLPLLAAMEVALLESSVDLRARLETTTTAVAELKKAIISLDLPRVAIADTDDTSGMSDTTGTVILIDLPFCSKTFVRILSGKGFDTSVGSACQTETETEWTDPAYREPYHVRISLTPGQSLDVSAFTKAFGESFIETHKKLLTKIEEHLLRDTA